jgi:signal transduction histidine kinase
MLPSNGAIRLERLRGFGAALGALVTCGCARLDFADGGHGILIVSAEAAGRTTPLVERLRDRVEALGGTLRIESIPGSGTNIVGSIPTRELEPAQ